VAVSPNEAALGGARLFRASWFWTWNVAGAVVGGLGGGLLFLVIGADMLWHAAGNRHAAFLGAALVVCSVGTLAALFPGNLVAAFPTAVEVKVDRGLVLIAPLKRVLIPFAEMRDIRPSLLQQGYVVRLRRRRGLLGRFVIHWAFGRDREPLAQAIRRTIARGAEEA
jgi:hypothetical protein